MTEGEEKSQYIVDSDNKKTEVEYLKDCVIRLTKELLSYQGSTQDETHLDGCYHGIDLPQWMMKSDIMSPLFLAYDRRIDDLSGMIEQQGSYMDKLTTTVSNLSQENLTLRERIKTLASPIDEVLARKVQVESGPGDEDAEMNCLRSDKALFEEQADLLVQELENANLSISSRDKTIVDLTHEIKSKLDFVETLQAKEKQLVREKNTAEQKLLDSVKDLEHHRQLSRDLTERVESLEDVHSDMTSKANVASSNRLDLEKKNEELHHKIKELSIFTQELENKLTSAMVEYEKLNEVYLLQTRELVSSKAESERLGYSLSKLKAKLLRTSNIHEGGACTSGDIKMRLKDIELSRDVLKAKVNSLQGEINRLLESRENSEEINRNRTELEKVKSQHCAEVEALEKMISSHKQTICDLEFTLERQERKMKEVLVKNEALQNSFNSERDSSSGVEKLNRALNNANSALDAQRRKYHEAEKEIIGLQVDVAKLKEAHEILSNDHQILQKEDNIKTRQLKDVQAAFRNDTEELNLKLQSMIIEKDDLEKAKIAAMVKAERQHESTISRLNLQIREQEKSLQMSSAALQECKDLFLKTESEYKADQCKVSKCLEESTAQFRQAHADQLTKIIDLQLKCKNLNEDRSRLDLRLKERERKIEAVTNDLGDAEEKITSLARQLSLNVKEQKMRIERETELKLENHILKLHGQLIKVDLDN